MMVVSFSHTQREILWILMGSKCLCLQERREVAIEKDTIMQMKEQIISADSTLQSKLLDHKHWMQLGADHNT
jgi:hypothetical protein